MIANPIGVIGSKNSLGRKGLGGYGGSEIGVLHIKLVLPHSPPAIASRAYQDNSSDGSTGSIGNDGQ